MYKIGKFQFESFKYTPGHRANYAVVTNPGNREWGLKYSPSYSYSSEHDVLKKFSHPQIPKRKYCDRGQLFQDDKLVLSEYYIVLQHFEGEDIVQYYKNKGLPDLKEMSNLIRYFQTLTEPLKYLHSKKKHVHTDIKAGHLILNLETSTIGLIDLELAIKIGDIIKGMTKEYAAPEQKLMMKLLQELPANVNEKTVAKQIAIDGRADLYSVGLILYEVLTNKLWVDTNEPPKNINSDVPEKLNNIVLGLLEEEPDNRLPSAEALFTELGSV